MKQFERSYNQGLSGTRKQLAVGTVFSLIVFGTAFVLLSPKQRCEPVPSFQGRTLSEWLDQLDYTHSQSDVMASNAIAQMGTTILPFLKPMLRAHDSVLKLQLVELLSKQSVVKIKFTPADLRREKASRACRVLGPASAEYLPELAAMVHSERPSTAWCGLVAIDDVISRMPAAAEVIKGLTNEVLFFQQARKDPPVL